MINSLAAGCGQMNYLMRLVSMTGAALFAATTMFGQAAAEGPKYLVTEGDYVAHDFKFKSGEQLAELRLHYRTLGKLVRDAQGRATNAVLILHGTGDRGNNFYNRNLLENCMVRGSFWTSIATLLFCRTELDTGNLPSPAMECMRIFLRMTTMTWWLLSMSFLRKG